METYLDTTLIDGRVGTFGSGEIDLGVWGEDIVWVSSLREVPTLLKMGICVSFCIYALWLKEAYCLAT